MTEVTVYRRGDGRLIGFEARGHCGFAARGQDIVCAAVSAIMNTAVYGVVEHLGKKAEISYGKDAEIDFWLTDSPDERSDAVLASMELGLRQVADQYRGFVRVMSGRKSQ
ncbi:MAG: ribosomal-processing cysteine protease Prp [Negativicutes bacterium]|nr:ribosomal-processing cysteine protease Prp [Negativicutes bacterium]